MKANIKTNKGVIKILLFYDLVPMTVSNFVNLSNRGFYNDLCFHRVIDDFMIQSGCPLGTGTGGPGYKFDDEFHPDLRHDNPGILSMANAGPNTNGSQFFITHIETPWLDNMHSVFGKILDDESQVIVNNISQNDKIQEIQIIDKLPSDKIIDKAIERWNIILNDN